MTDSPDIPLPPDPPERSLREQAVESARWVMIGRVINEGSSFLGLIVLSRLLTPAQFGIAVLALVFSALSSSLLGSGFGSPLVKYDTVSSAHIEVAMWLSILSGLVLTLFCLGLSRALIGVIGRESADLVGLVSPVIILNAIAVVPQSLRSRHLDFRRLMVIEAIAGTITTAGSVAFALLGAGAESLVLGVVAGAAAVVVLSLPGSGARLPRWHREEARAIFSFGWSASLSSLFYAALRNVDYAILSGRLPAADVGLYFRAYTLVFDYQMKFSQVVTRILFPLLSRADPSKTEVVRSRVIQLHTVVLFPCLAFLGVTAPELVPLLLGSQWVPAVEPIQILAIGGIALTIGTGIGPTMMAAGHPRPLFIYNLVSFFAFSITVLVCSSYGLTVVCVGVAIYRLVGLVANQYFLATRILGIPLRRSLIEDPGPAFVCSVALMAVVYGVVQVVQGLGAPAAVIVVSAAALGFATYALALRFLFSKAWQDFAMVAMGVVPARITRRLPVPLRSSRGVG